jgi:uncharacterized protein (DUF305 family)
MVASRCNEPGRPLVDWVNLLAAWGVPASPGGMGPWRHDGTHGRHGPSQGPGMMSGTTFDRMFLQSMIVHHQGAIDKAD